MWEGGGREKKRARNTERPGAFVPREPPWPGGVRAAQPAGSCSSRPRGAWEAGEGPGFLSADSAGRAPGPPHSASGGRGAA